MKKISCHNLRGILSSIIIAGLGLGIAGAVSGQENRSGEEIYNARGCGSCHTIGGGDLIGPDLLGIDQTRERIWIVDFLINPDGFGVPAMAGASLTREESELVTDYILSKGGGMGSGSVEIEIPEGDPANGKKLFLGEISFKNGGPSCIACHTAGNNGPFSGGTLGPELTDLSERYEPAVIVNMLKSLPFPTMKPLYENRQLTDREVADLSAFLGKVNEQYESGKGSAAKFRSYGLYSAIVFLCIGAFAFRNRFSGALDKLVPRK
ncbi:MAG TPA: c-type cytochrome [bacterium]|jgi:mono/diheme cytochrome c family protein